MGRIGKIVVVSLTIVIAFFTAISMVEAASDSLITVGSDVDKNKVTIGERINYEIKVSGRSGFEVEFPVFDKKIGDFEIKDSFEKRSNILKKETISKIFIIDIFDTGQKIIPKAVIKYKLKGDVVWHEVETDEIPIVVESVLDKEPGVKDIKDIKGPIGFPDKYAFLLFTLALFAAILILAGMYLYLKKKYKEFIVNVIPKKTPYEKAVERLMILKKKGLPEKGMFTEYYVELSNIVRYYLEDRFNLRAPEMTTEEFLNKVRAGWDITSVKKTFLKDFLSHCDLVKFAKYGPSTDEAILSLKSAEKFLEETKEPEMETEGK